MGVRRKLRKNWNNIIEGSRRVNADAIDRDAAMNGDSSKEVTRCLTIQNVMWDSELLRERSNLQDALILLKLEGKKLRRAEHEGFVGSVDLFRTAAAEFFAFRCCTNAALCGCAASRIGAIEANLPSCSGYIDWSVEGSRA